MEVHEYSADDFEHVVMTTQDRGNRKSMNLTDTLIRLRVARRIGVNHAHALRADRRDAIIMELQERERRGGYLPAEREFIRTYVK